MNRWLLLPVLALAFATVPLACGSDPAAGGFELAAETDLFPGFAFDTGLQPPAAPVQASFALKAGGTATAAVQAIASDGDAGPALYGVPGTGKVTVKGSFSLEGKLHIAVSGLPSYDGPIPGLENTAIAIDGSEPFEPFAEGEETDAKAAIPPTKLPDIPLPGGIPGHLVIEIAEGSSVTVGFAAMCASTDGKTAKLGGTITRSGTLVLHPSIEIQVPVLGTKSFPIPAVTVDLGSLPSSDVLGEAEVPALGDAPEGSLPSKVACEDDGSGGAGPSGASSATGNTSGNPGVTSSGTGATDMGTCNDNIDASSYPELDSCLEKHCCAEVDECTVNGTDPGPCIDCVNAGGGAVCGSLVGCVNQCTGGSFPVCGGAFALPDEGTASCVDAWCCNDVQICSQGGSDPVGCEQCLEAGGGAACNGLLACAQESCATTLTGGF